MLWASEAFDERTYPLEVKVMVARKSWSALTPLFSRVNSSLNSGPRPKIEALMITLASEDDQMGPCPVVIDLTYALAVLSLSLQRSL